MAEGKTPPTKHGLIPMLVAIRVTAEKRRRAAEAAARAEGAAQEVARPRKKKGWFG